MLKLSLMEFQIGRSYDLALKLLNDAVEIIISEVKYRTTIQLDKGWHYQHNKWMRTLKKNKFFQCMSKN